MAALSTVDLSPLSHSCTMVEVLHILQQWQLLPGTVRGGCRHERCGGCTALCTGQWLHEETAGTFILFSRLSRSSSACSHTLRSICSATTIAKWEVLSACLDLKWTNEAFDLTDKIFSDWVSSCLAPVIQFAFRNNVGMICRSSFLVTSNLSPGPPDLRGFPFWTRLALLPEQPPVSTEQGPGKRPASIGQPHSQRTPHLSPGPPAFRD